MIKRFVFLFMVVIQGTNTLQAQTAKDIEARFGGPEKVYSVTDKLWMTPTYNAEGQLCLMRLYPRVVTKESNCVGCKLDLDEVLKFLNEFIPVNTRGRRGNRFGTSDLGGHIIQTYFEYENVVLVFVSSFELKENPKAAGGVALDNPDEFLAGVGFDFPIPSDESMAEYKRKEAMKSDDQHIREHAFHSNVLEVYWPLRKCLQP